jgi:hypothetical protein
MSLGRHESLEQCRRIAHRAEGGDYAVQVFGIEDARERDRANEFRRTSRSAAGVRSWMANIVAEWRDRSEQLALMLDRARPGVLQTAGGLAIPRRDRVVLKRRLVLLLAVAAEPARGVHAASFRFVSVLSGS